GSKAEKAIIGIRAVLGVFLIAFVASTPLMSGNLMSMRIRSGFREIAFSTASSPVAASKVSYPPDRSSKRTNKDLTSSLSSTTHILRADMSSPNLEIGRKKEQSVRSKAHAHACYYSGTKGNRRLAV